ncbi:FMN-binding protein [Pengzhenrongella sp.]|uniref:FMN-binding protein n=1 Tax=Pengzhenrongella sp. TaxID=2888820 RepID=UPI002F940F87
MRRIVITIGTTLSGLVLLFLYPTSLNRISPPPVPAAGGATGATGSGTAGKAAAGTAKPAPAPAAAAPPKTYAGSVAQTPYGPVQVQITVAAGAVTKSEAIQLPSGSSRDDQIKANAVPVLNSEAVAAGSAKIAMVSGATYTSNAYTQSLQSALDQAGV